MEMIGVDPLKQIVSPRLWAGVVVTDACHFAALLWAVNGRCRFSLRR